MNPELSLADKLYKSFEEGVNGDNFFPNLPDSTRQEYRKAVLALTEHWCYHFPNPGRNGEITLGIQTLDQALEFVNFLVLVTTGKPGRLFQRLAESIKLYGNRKKDEIYDNCIAMLKKEKSRSEIDGDLDRAQQIKPFIKLLKNEMKSVPIISNSDQMLSKIIDDMKEFIELTSFMWVPGKPVEYISWRDANGDITDDPSKVVDKVPSLFPQWVQADDEDAFVTIYNRELEARGGVDIEGSVFTRTLAEHVKTMIAAYELATPAKVRDIKLIQSAEKFLSWLGGDNQMGSNLHSNTPSQKIIAAVQFYRDEAITEENYAEICKKWNTTGSRKIYQVYNFWCDRVNRTGDEGTDLKNKNKEQLFEKIEQILKNEPTALKKAQDERLIFSKALNK